MAACAEPAPTKVTLTAQLSGGPKYIWDALIPVAEEKFEDENPNIDLEVNYKVCEEYPGWAEKLLSMAANRDQADIVAVDHIWLGQFVETGYIKDITDEAKKWDIEQKLYQPYLEGCKYNGKYYGVWSWTDARLVWFWKDILEKADVEPRELKTWEGFLNAVPKIKQVAEAEGMSGVVFPREAWLVDWWYPFLFQNGGSILIETDGGYKAGFDNNAGTKAAEFLLEMKKAGVEFSTEWKWGKEFTGRSYAAYFGGSWVLREFSEEELANIEERVGVIMFPAPAGKESRSLNGGYVLTVPVTSEHPEIAWEFTRYLLDPDIQTPWLVKFGFLPTSKEIVENPKYATQFERVPFWPEFEKSLSLGAARPNIPGYSLVAEILYEELLKVINEKTTPEEAIRAAAEKVNALWHYPWVISLGGCSP